VAYVHAHRHGEFSRLDGCGTADLYAAEAARLGQGVLGLTDHGTLSGALHHIEACKAQKILPIVGVEAYYRPNRVVAKRFKQREAWHLCLYAKNLTGWHSLLRLVSAAFQEVHDGGGFYQYPCIDAELLQRHRAGLVASSACVNSYLAKLIANGDHVLVNEYIDQMLSLFGDDFWLEVMPHDFEDQRYLNQILVDIARERSIGLLATNDAHFPLKEWAETHRVAKLCGSASSFEKARKDKEKGKADYLADLNPHLYLASEAEMRQWFADYHPMIPSFTVDEAIENTQVFASRFVPFLLDRSLKLPRAAEQEERAVQESTEQILERWIREGWERLSETYPEAHWEKWPKPIYEARLAHEWEILQNKGVIDYFVLVGDVVRWAKARGIRVGLGRGSAAGCLISYLIGITAIDPISWGLLFERFLNPERKGLPDIDLDFQSDRRHEVKEYVSSKRWCEACGVDHDGSAHVADIITHARFQPKSVLQAIGRTFDLPYPEMLALTDTIEIRADSEETTLEELLPLNEKLRDWKSAYPELWSHCLRLEGTVQNAGKHAAGIIITPKPVVEYMALERGKKGDLVTSWSDSADFQAISDYGFVKIDCLGITGLAKHAYTCSLIRKRYEIDLDLNALAPLRDPTDAEEPVLDGFRQGHTVGVFQFGGHAITALVREINPDSTLDLSATNALYRPGPINSGVHRSYAKRKHDPTQVSYWSELVQPVLAETYGLVAYQEQVMEITKQLGGFSGAEADDMRKAMGKLYRIKGGRAAKDFMAQYEQKWFAGCSSRGIAKKTADEIWEKILEFGHYGFNKSHSASYALQAYQDMWLKTHYPLEFYAAFLTYEDDSERVLAAIREAKARKIPILAPSVQTSGIGWMPDADGLRMSLVAIKGVGAKGAAEIIKQRAYGPFADLDDLRQRIPARALNAKAFEALRECGALDCFDARADYSDLEKAAAEKHLLGMTFTSLPELERHADTIRANIYSQDECRQYGPGTSVIVGGEIHRIDKKQTKRGSTYATITLIFELNEWRVRFWKEALIEYDHMLKIGNMIMVTGKTDEWNGNMSVVARDVTDQFDGLWEENGGRN
jgi:DNA polymerase-3 subunit alpha